MEGHMPPAPMPDESTLKVVSTEGVAEGKVPAANATRYSFKQDGAAGTNGAL